MYPFSRDLYRRLARDLADGGPPVARSDHERVLQACERAFSRLAEDRFAARPARNLFREIRGYFPRSAQERVYTTVERHLSLTASLLAREPQLVTALTGEPPRCPAATRQGRDCSRTPHENGYCWFHRHLAEDAYRSRPSSSAIPCPPPMQSVTSP